MSLEKKTFTLCAYSREEARKEVVLEFLKEKAGTGRGNLAAKYEYTVEKFDKYEVVLQRPAQFNHGFDFTVCTPGIYYKPPNQKKRSQKPSHDAIKQILSTLKQEKNKEYEVVKKIIQDIYYLKQFDIEALRGFYFCDVDKKERPLAIVLLSLRWLFIEQDITYWNTSGRVMLMKALSESGLATFIEK